MVRLSTICIVLCLALMLRSPLLPAQPRSIHIVNPVWLNFAEADGSGFYFDLMRGVYQPLGIAVNIDIIPWSRAALLLQKQKADAMLGSYLESPELYHYPSQPVWLDVSAVAFKYDRFAWRGVQTLKDKQVGWIRGYDYHKYLEPAMHFHEVSKNHQGWNMLARDRLDFYMDSITDLRLYMKQHQLSAETYAIEPVLIKPMYVRLAKTEKGKQLADIYDQRIAELARNGHLEKLYKKWGYEDFYANFIKELKLP